MENQFNHKNQNYIKGTYLIPQFVNILLSKDIISYSYMLIQLCDASANDLLLAPSERCIPLPQRLYNAHSIALNPC